MTRLVTKVVTKRGMFETENGTVYKTVALPVELPRRKSYGSTLFVFFRRWCKTTDQANRVALCCVLFDLFALFGDTFGDTVPCISVSGTRQDHTKSQADEKEIPRPYPKGGAMSRRVVSPKIEVILSADRPNQDPLSCQRRIRRKSSE